MGDLVVFTEASSAADRGKDIGLTGSTAVFHLFRGYGVFSVGNLIEVIALQNNGKWSFELGKGVIDPVFNNIVLSWTKDKDVIRISGIPETVSYVHRIR